MLTQQGMQKACFLSVGPIYTHHENKCHLFWLSSQDFSLVMCVRHINESADFNDILKAKLKSLLPTVGVTLGFFPCFATSYSKNISTSPMTCTNFYQISNIPYV